MYIFFSWFMLYCIFEFTLILIIEYLNYNLYKMVYVFNVLLRERERKMERERELLYKLYK